MQDSSKEVNLGNNVTWFHLECDIFGTDNEKKQAASPFLHNLSSILYMGSREGAPTGVPSSHRADRVAHRAGHIGLSASGVTRWAPGVVRRALCVVRCVARGSCKLAENFFKKVLDRNRRSVNIVDAPFAGN